jgi:hypothetical protein
MASMSMPYWISSIILGISSGWLGEELCACLNTYALIHALCFLLFNFIDVATIIYFPNRIGLVWVYGPPISTNMVAMDLIVSPNYIK